MKRIVLILLAACGSHQLVSQPTKDEAKLTIPTQNDPATVDIGAWNLEWFGHPARGPSDEVLQRDNAAAVLTALDLDIVGVGSLRRLPLRAERRRSERARGHPERREQPLARRVEQLEPRVPGQSGDRRRHLRRRDGPAEGAGHVRRVVRQRLSALRALPT